MIVFELKRTNLAQASSFLKRQTRINGLGQVLISRSASPLGVLLSLYPVPPLLLIVLNCFEEVPRRFSFGVALFAHWHPLDPSHQ